MHIAIALVVAAIRPFILPADPHSILGSWQGEYKETGLSHPIAFIVTANRKIVGSYDNHDGLPGKILGSISPEGEMKLVFKYGRRKAWGQLEGSVTLTPDGLALQGQSLEFWYPIYRLDKYRFPATIACVRPK